MISIIIPSRNALALNRISENISKTIGVPFEIIDYDNTDDGFGICKIYNVCAAKAICSYLVFCHDDIEFCSHDWGKVLLKILGETTIGIVGVTGATFKSKYPAPWVSIPQKHYRCQLTNNFPDNESDYEEVAVLDGCFMAMRKQVWEEFKWNDRQIPDFHLYDIDISERVFRNYRLVVAKNLSVNHRSEGNFDEIWFKQSKNYFEINSNKFPITVERMSPKYEDYLNAYSIKSLLFRRGRINLSIFEVLTYSIQILINYPKIFSFGLLKNIIKPK
ncbi:Glycosyltransferase like family protein [Flavobacteriaceae bacterium MAR_2010_188]|nr:Glycosyltransferase like family protein [Flavobacteriaceae bacterium MAR_2010_188]